MEKTVFRFGCLVSLLMTMLMAQSCDPLSAIPEQLPATREGILSAIEEASREIRSGLDIKTALLKVDEAMQKVDQTVFYSIPWIIQHTLVETTASTLCVQGILEDKAIYYLAKLKSEIITGEKVLPPPPRICGSSHYILDLNSPVPKIIKFAGEFYDTVRNDIGAYLVKGGDDFRLTNLLLFQGPNAFTLNLTSFSDDYLADFDYLSIRSRETELYAMSIIPKEAEPPVKQVIDFSLPTISVLGNQCGDGDLDFGEGPEVTIKIWFRRSRNRLYANIDFDAISRKRNGTVIAHACAKEEIFLYQAPEGMHIEDLYSPVLDFSQVYHHHYLDDDEGDDPFYFPWALLTVSGNSAGIDVGSSTGVIVNFTQQVRITLAEGG